MNPININLKLIPSIIALLLSFHTANGQKNFNNPTCSITSPVIFNYQGDSVFYEFDLEVPGANIKSNAMYVITPQIVLLNNNDTTVYTLPSVTFEGKTNRNIRIRNKKLYGIQERNEEQILITHKDSTFHFPYKGSLYLTSGSQICGVIIDSYQNSCCQYIPFKPQATPYTLADAGGENLFIPSVVWGNGETSDNLKMRKVEGRAFLNFEINKSEIKLSDGQNKQQITQMTEAFRKVITDPYARFDSALIKGQSSPEGPFEFNNKLALSRSNAALQFLKKELNVLNMNYNDSLFNVSFIPEAWDELYSKIEASDMKDKESILEIIRNTPVKAEREYKLRQKRNAFNYIRNNFLGNIRRVDYTYFFTFKDLTLNEQVRLLNIRPDIYSPSDFLSVTNYSTDKSVKRSILSTAVKYYPNDTEVLASLLASYIEESAWTEISQLLNEINTPELHARNYLFLRNISIYYLRTGQSEKLSELIHALLFNKEILKENTSDEINYIQGLLLLKQRKYAGAYQYLEKAADFNTVSALLGLKEYDKAWSIIKNKTCEKASEYYLKAVAAAYVNDKDTAVKTLRSALEKDPDLKKQAAKENAFWGIDIL